MTRTGLILYGPPASGKDTLTAALARQAPHCLLHRRLKVGTGNDSRYRMSTISQLAALRANGEVLYENVRYGNRYAFIRSHLEEDLALGTPILHVGQIEGLRRLHTYPVRWCTVALWCSRKITEQRSIGRGDIDVAQRLAAWDETERDFSSSVPNDFDLVQSTDQTPFDDVVSSVEGLIFQR